MHICIHIARDSVQVIAYASVFTVRFMLTTEVIDCARIVTVRFMLTTEVTDCARIVTVRFMLTTEVIVRGLLLSGLC